MRKKAIGILKKNISVNLFTKEVKSSNRKVLFNYVFEKERVKLIDAYCKREGVSPPEVKRFRNYLDPKYAEAKEVFSNQLTAAGLNFEVQISRC